jgi:hypothetical protein
MVMRGWFKQASKLMLSVATSVMLVYPTTGFSEQVIGEEPSALAMFGDTIFVRPLLLAATAVGAGVFVITLPFSAMGGNVGESADVLVGTPADALLFRCLGCSGQEDLARDAQKAEAKEAQAAVDAAAEAAEEAAEAAEKAERAKQAEAAKWQSINPQCKNLWCR